MTEEWLMANEQRFEAELLAGFCACHRTLVEQFSRFERTGNLSFSILNEMVGDMMTRGRLWRLKDLSHHILCNRPGLVSAAHTLEWVIGYIFHETVKLVELAHQARFYEPRILALRDEGHLPPELASTLVDICRDAHSGEEQTIRRLGRLLSVARILFCRFFQGKGSNRCLARFMWEKESLVREVFRDHYPELISALYGGAPERLYLEAAASLLEGGYTDKAWAALEKARQVKPDCSFPSLPFPAD